MLRTNAVSEVIFALPALAALRRAYLLPRSSISDPHGIATSSPAGLGRLTG
jgi:hypothetical protein